MIYLLLNLHFFLNKKALSDVGCTQMQALRGPDCCVPTRPLLRSLGKEKMGIRKAQNECRLVAKYNLVVEFSVKLGCVVSTPLRVA